MPNYLGCRIDNAIFNHVVHQLELHLREGDSYKKYTTLFDVISHVWKVKWVISHAG